MIVKVTQEHIDKARRALKQSNARQAICCPIGQALNKKYWISTDCVNMINGDRELCELPVSAIAFIDRFDSNKKVKPFEFEINL